MDILGYYLNNFVGYQPGYLVRILNKDNKGYTRMYSGGWVPLLEIKWISDTDINQGINGYYRIYRNILIGYGYLDVFSIHILILKR